LFGKLVPPPYRVELSGDVIEINGVVVFPSPGPLSRPPDPSARVTDIFDRMSSARETYTRNRTVLGAEGARAALVVELKQIPGFKQVDWVSDDEVRIIRQDGIEERMSFAELRPTDPDNEQAQQAFLQAQAELLRGVLKDNGTILCGATYLIPVQDIPADSFRQKVNGIVTSGEPEALKLARLQVYTGNRDAAADLLFAR
jgi:hypothetical protein